MSKSSTGNAADTKTKSLKGDERRRYERGKGIPLEPPGLMLVDFEQQNEPIADASVLDMSVGGAALRSKSPIVPGERVAFNVGGDNPPVLCLVVACDRMEDGWFRVRCKCILGGFDLDNNGNPIND
jgi:hypothetical protein